MRLVTETEPLSTIASYYNVSPATVRRIALGLTWTHTHTMPQENPTP